MTIKVTIESDVEGVYPVIVDATEGMYRNSPLSDRAQDAFIERVTQACAEVFCTERNKQRAPIE